ncbi:MAG TPA: arylsulfotransferase family protein [Aliidongia sp.]|nr:arylsulfotransferase family protein [Aliidongia sp.]
MRWRRAGLIACLCIAALVVGVATERLDMEPAPTIRGVLSSIRVTVAMLRRAAGQTVQASLGDRPLPEHSGTVIHDGSAMAPGLTLLATGGPEVTLMAADGKAVHRWRVPVEQLFTLPGLLRPEDITIDGLVLLPDGSLLALLLDEEEFPAFHWDDTVMNTVLVKIDKDSKLIWSFTGNPHHDVRQGPDGHFFVLVGREGQPPAREGLPIPAQFRDEGVAEIDADGHPLRTIWLSDALGRSPYAQTFAVLDEGWFGCPRDQHYCWDLFHANTVQIISKNVAEKFPQVSEGDLLVNLRDMDTVVVIDRKTGLVHWARRGNWHHAHDAELTEQGTLMIFDNRANIGGAEPSRILEIDPKNGAELWSYDGGTSHPFSSSVRGTKQALPNGNVLVTESTGGRAFEVTRAGDLAWEYVSPPVAGTRFAPVIWGAQRIDPADYAFLQNCASCGTQAAHAP